MIDHVRYIFCSILAWTVLFSYRNMSRVFEVDPFLSVVANETSDRLGSSTHQVQNYSNFLHLNNKVLLNGNPSRNTSIESQHRHDDETPQVSHNTSHAVETNSSLSIEPPFTATENQSVAAEQPPPIDHPHAGARFPNGTWGYVADVTAVRKRMLSMYRNSTQESTAISLPRSFLPLTKADLEGSVCGDRPGQGSEGSGGWKLLTEKVQVTNETDVLLSSHPTNSNISSIPRILCAIYTTVSKTPNIQAIGETYGWRCDGFFAASTETREDIGAIDLPHLGPETYMNMWQKTRSILAYMYDNYLDDYDFFYLVGDDTHLIVENLKAMLSAMGRQAIDYPLYLGNWYPNPARKRGPHFVGGGGGYVLNRKSLRILVNHCLKHHRTTSQVSHEDRLVGVCLSSMNVPANSSVDETGAQTFHMSHPQVVATFHGGPGRFRWERIVYEFWGRHWGYKAGFNLTSSRSVAFHHLKTPDMMRRHHAILYNSCPQGTALQAALA